MKNKSLMCGVGGLLVGVTLAGAVGMQDPATQDPAAIMEANYARYMEVTEHHKELARRAGNWNVKAEFQVAPGAPMESMDGTSTSTLIYDGRYLHETFSGTMPESMGGAVFEGQGISGYDNFKEKFVGVWIDSMSSGIYTSESTEGENGTHFVGESPDFLTGKFKMTKSVERWEGANSRIIEMFEPGPDGEDVLTMRLTYTRAGRAR